MKSHNLYDCANFILIGREKMKKIKNLALVTLLSLTSIGCGSLPEADSEVVSNYKHKELDTAKYDTGIYLIRPSLFLGGGRDFWVAVDDKTIGDLPNGSYVFLPLNSDENLTVNTVMDMNLLHPIAVTNNTESPFSYYKIGLTNRTAEPIDESVAITTIHSMTEHKLDYVERKNDGYDNLSMNPSLVTSLTTESTANVKAGNKQGELYIFRESKDTMNTPASIWLDKQYAGELRGGDFIKIPVPKGKHIINRRDGDFRTLEIDVKPGYSYFIDLKFSQGWTSLNHIPTALDATNQSTMSKINKWLLAFTEMTMIPKEDRSEYQNKILMKGQAFMDKHETEFENATVVFPGEYAIPISNK